jgi:hypothetical protein
VAVEASAGNLPEEQPPQLLQLAHGLLGPKL